MRHAIVSFIDRLNIPPFLITTEHSSCVVLIHVSLQKTNIACSKKHTFHLQGCSDWSISTFRMLNIAVLLTH